MSTTVATASVIPSTHRSPPSPVSCPFLGMPVPIRNTRTKTTTANSEAKATRASKAKNTKRWTEEETRCLTEGVARFGVGKWLKIKRLFRAELEGRSNVDLKDRWRNIGGQRQGVKRRKYQVPSTS